MKYIELWYRNPRYIKGTYVNFVVLPQGMKRCRRNMRKEIKIYHYSDGRSSIEVAKAVGLKSHASILEYWKRWGRIGIMDVITVRGGRRYVKAFNLEDFGIEIPTNNRGDMDA